MTYLKVHESVRGEGDDISALHKKAYELIGHHINKGKIKTWSEVFTYIGHNAMSLALGFRSTNFKKSRIDSTDAWKKGDILKFSKLTGADPVKVFKLLLTVK